MKRCKICGKGGFPHIVAVMRHLRDAHGIETMREVAPDSFAAEIQTPIQKIIADKLGVREHVGYRGAFTTNEAPGAYRNGTRVAKVQADADDLRPIGAKATVLGSLFHPELGIGYFLEWDDSPRMAVLCMARKVLALD